MEHIKSFKNKGIYLIKNFYSKKELNQIKKNTNLIKKQKTKKFVGVMKYYEDDIYKKNKVLVRAEYFYKKNKNLTNLIDGKRIKSILRKITGDQCIIFKEKINYKPPGCRKDKLHQDMQGDWRKYTKNFISALISVDKSTKKNGCLEFDISGNNHLSLRGKIFKELKISQLKKPSFKKIILNPGDIVFFNAYIPHKSGKNFSKLSRTQIYLTYNIKKDGNFRKAYFNEKRINFPPNNERKEKKLYKYKI